MTKSSYLDCLIALLFGATMPLAFAPLNEYVMVFPAITLLLILWLHATPKKAFLQGLLFGVGMFGVGTSWVYISIHRYGNTSVLLALIITCLFVLILALFPAIQGYLFSRFFSRRLIGKALFAFPALWVIGEWLRGWIFSGFPWLMLADSQVHSPLAGIIPIVGREGTSFTIALLCTLLASVYQIKQKRWQKALLLVLLLIVSQLLTLVHWTKPRSEQWYSVSLIQGNIPQEIKWQRNFRTHVIELYHRLTQQHWNSDLIIWPEGAIPAFRQSIPGYLESLDDLAKQHKTALLLGMPVRAGNSFNYYNSMIMLGNGQGVYYKRHLVPFGEYLPFSGLLRGLIGFFNIPMSDFIAGPMKQPLLTAQNIKIAPFVCYEIAYSDVLLQALPDAELLVTISDDAWFGDSLAPAQHLQIAQLRSIESGRYLLFGTNNGITAIVTPKGIIKASAPQFTNTVLTGKIQAMTGSTPWSRIGTMPIMIVIFGLLWISKRVKS